MRSTPYATPTTTTKSWFVIDAADIPLGRLASRVATVLRGKHRPQFTPSMDVGDFVVIVNAGKVALTGNKRKAKIRYTHSGFPGGLKEETYENLLERKPELAVQEAVRGMLPKNKLGRATLKKLKVYRDLEHPHAAQNPKALTLDGTILA